jgi:NAD(P) transhydrogenase
MRLLGVYVIGEHASELAHLGLLAMLMRAGSELFDRACFNLPTLGDLYRIATYKALLARHRARQANSSNEFSVVNLPGLRLSYKL